MVSVADRHCHHGVELSEDHASLPCRQRHGHLPTARHIWDQLLAASTQVRSVLDTDVSQAAFEKLQSTAEEQGRPIYEALVQEHRARIAREREKADYAFAARRRTIDRIGLPQVRNYRLNLLTQEERKLPGGA